MKAGPNLLTLEQIGTYSAQYERKEITEEQFMVISVTHVRIVELALSWALPLRCK